MRALAQVAMAEGLAPVLAQAPALVRVLQVVAAMLARLPGHELVPDQVVLGRKPARPPAPGLDQVAMSEWLTFV